ncbi:MAG TPA: hypothetical protein VG963_22235 [Polyangiaceae bacterium]|nr:hypothetical protein [Polyangiaceae bacterium]
MNRGMLLGLLCLLLDIPAVQSQDDWSSPLLEPPPGTPLTPPPAATPLEGEVVTDGNAPDSFGPQGPQAYMFKADIAVELPIPLTDEHDAAGVGAGLSGAFGWDLGFLVPTANIGWSWTPLHVPSEYGDRSLTRFHMGVGLMAELENRSFVVPVLGAMLDLNWWHVTGDVGVACGGYYYWGCYAYNRYDYTTGFTFKAGLDFRLPRNDRFSLGAGVLPTVTLSGGPFQSSEWWISPYVVFTIRG